MCKASTPAVTWMPRQCISTVRPTGPVSACLFQTPSPLLCTGWREGGVGLGWEWGLSRQPSGEGQGWARLQVRGYGYVDGCGTLMPGHRHAGLLAAWRKLVASSGHSCLWGGATAAFTIDGGNNHPTGYTHTDKPCCFTAAATGWAC